MAGFALHLRDMMKRYRRWIPHLVVFLASLTAGLLYVAFSQGRASYRAVRQPVLFNHYVHTKEQELACEECHQGVKTGYFATYPTVETCSICHSEPVGNTEKELRFVEDYVNKAQEIHWQRLFKIPDHVFFSHRIHVVRAEIECMTCHAGMEEQTQPPSRPLKVLTMKECMGCHQEREATLDCNSCHR